MGKRHLEHPSEIVDDFPLLTLKNVKKAKSQPPDNQVSNSYQSLYKVLLKFYQILH